MSNKIIYQKLGLDSLRDRDFYKGSEMEHLN